MLVGGLGAFITFQTANIKFIFGDNDFYLKVPAAILRGMMGQLLVW